MSEAIDPELLSTTVTVYRPIDGGVDLLRQFIADVGYRGEDDEEGIGSVTGWIGWQILDQDVHDAADEISSDAEILGQAAAQIIDDYPENYIDTVLLIDRMHLDAKWRGHRLSGAIINDLMALLRLDNESTAVVLQPEPQRPKGGPMPYGPERDRAMARLEAAYEESGLQRWADTIVWWRPLTAP